MTRDPDDERRWYVYYCYAADGTLLYVGQSQQPEQRFHWHQYYSGATWPWHCTRVEVGAELLTQADAHAAEREAITSMRPACNVHHNSDPASWTPVGDKRQYDSLPEFTRTPSVLPSAGARTA